MHFPYDCSRIDYLCKMHRKVYQFIHSGYMLCHTVSNKMHFPLCEPTQYSMIMYGNSKRISILCSNPTNSALQ